MSISADNKHLTADDSPQWARDAGRLGRVYQLPGDPVSMAVPDAVSRGLLMPSVTTVLNCRDKPFLLEWHSKLAVEHMMAATQTWPDRVTAKPDEYQKWAIGAAPRYTSHRARIGTLVHEHVEHLLRGTTPPPIPADVEDEVRAYVGGFEKFHQEFPLTYTEVEVTLYGSTGDDLPYAGTADFLATYQGLPLVGDWKTSKRIYDSHEAQVEALSHGDRLSRGMTTEQLSDQPAAGLVVSLRPHKFSARLVQFTGHHWFAFEGLRREWQYQATATRTSTVVKTAADILTTHQSTTPVRSTSEEK